MKQLILTIAFFLFSLAITAQNQIKICQNKATHLIAKEKITYVQVGDPDKLIAEVVPEKPNMVRVKALDEFSEESSLTMVSANRSYSLFVKYSDADRISYILEDFHWEKAGDLNIGPVPEYYLKELCSQILRKDIQKPVKAKSHKDGIIFRLRNIYLKQDLLFFELKLATPPTSLWMWMTTTGGSETRNVQRPPTFRNTRWIGFTSIISGKAYPQKPHCEKYLFCQSL